MPYLYGDVIYSLRNEFLHASNPNVTKEKIKDDLCKIDEFELLLGKTLTSDTSMVSYGADMSVSDRRYTVNVYLLCTRLCKEAKKYYLNNKEKFDFFNYNVSYIDN